MTDPFDFRELAQRADLEFHKKPRLRPRLAWWSGVILASLSGVFVLYAAFVRNNRLYEAGPLSDSHAFIANDCRQCHTTWQPLQRLTTGSPAASIDNNACLRCHKADMHQPHQIPAHEEMSCAECHREHLGRHTLAKVTDRHCIKCHANLERDDKQPSQFTAQIRGFAKSSGHPDFNLTERIASPDAPSNLMTREQIDVLLKDKSPKEQLEGQYKQRFLDVLKKQTSGDQPGAKAAWKDRGDIKFRHDKHLALHNPKDKNGKPVDLAGNCQACHVVDSAGQYMQPINYEQHCAQCHALVFDNDKFPGEVVPHETPEVVRGFLTEKYTLTMLKNAGQIADPAPVPRPFPGQPDLPTLTEEKASQTAKAVEKGEEIVRNRDKAITSAAGCKLCHTVNQPEGQRDWSIAPTQIPERWMPHSQFNHAAHRMLSCVYCHRDVDKKGDTGDVMLPTIQQCRHCHISEFDTPSRVTSDLTDRPNVAHDVPSRCMMCHTYHRRHSTESPGTHMPPPELRSTKK